MAETHHHPGHRRLGRVHRLLRHAGLRARGRACSASRRSSASTTPCAISPTTGPARAISPWRPTSSGTRSRASTSPTGPTRNGRRPSSSTGASTWTRGIDDLKATAAHMRAMAGCSGKVGTVGFCLGGKLAYMLACRADLDANVGYYGVGIEEMLDEAANISAPAHAAYCGGGRLRAEGGAGSGPKDGPRRQRPYAGPLLSGHGTHAFARIGGQPYDEENAALANGRTARAVREGAERLTPPRDGSRAMPDPLEVLQRVFGFEAFRGHQRAAHRRGGPGRGRAGADADGRGASRSATRCRRWSGRARPSSSRR